MGYKEAANRQETLIKNQQPETRKQNGGHDVINEKKRGSYISENHQNKVGVLHTCKKIISAAICFHFYALLLRHV